ncbi:MAG: DNA polymerase I [Comamonadaceae bacterium CG1_02_60_18]|nr:MAG: DNA polymerase I [Comamonadaceae bacterium CG1_02_60_18]PIQ52897.1 MAG: DNA polymerase I [Comamonadaceae bacterium CG12_big_fil_rev_8_21_14_0_65_59_15]
MHAATFTEGIYLVDFEFHPAGGRQGNPPVPVCLVVRAWPSGRTQRHWQADLQQMAAAPFPTGENALCVAYYASAEMDCFHALGWPHPVHVLDLFTEFRCLTNGLRLPYGNSLLGALLYYGLPSIGGEQKDAMRDLVLTRGPWSDADQLAILDYCETDVVALAHLLTTLQDQIDWPRALLRGRYMKAVSCIQTHGIPIDTAVLTLLQAQWSAIQDQLIADVDSDYGIFDGRTFKTARWESYLVAQQIAWPRLPSGALDLGDATFREMARTHVQVAPIRELRSALSEMRLANLHVGDDGRNRCLLSPFRSRTGRNQPSNSKFIFGPSVWLRGLIKPQPGWGLAYVDWSQQEFGIAAALSGDPAMMAAYRSGDPYLAFAIQAGAVPATATKKTHEFEREQFKACVLAVQYGMGEASLALRINQPVARARQLLELHRRTYRRFWTWSDSAVDEAVLGGRLWAGFGWQIHTRDELNDRSLRNFPMQANGAEMLRIASILLTEAGIRVCAPVHDALLIEAPLDELDAAITTTKTLMQEASRIVLDGFELGGNVKEVRWPDRYMDKRGVVMWNKVMHLLGQPTLA